MKNRMVMIFVTTMLIFACAGCKEQVSSTGRIDSTNSVDQIINEQIDTENKNEQNMQSQTAKEDIKEQNIEEQNSEENVSTNAIRDNIQSDRGKNESVETVDIDLTEMGSDMVYATVYQLMVNPETYKGKTICMSGSYYATYYEPTSKYYHYCVIQDATACCSQGMEFIWGDGNHEYPDEYPNENAEIRVTGIFETYQEEGDPNIYCRLKNATLEVNAVFEG